ncbi:MAG: hypothetical protein WBH75_06855 [Thermoanaerobaculia bacterium]
MSSTHLSRQELKSFVVVAAMMFVGVFLSARCSSADDFSEQQRESLAAVFYRGNPMPPPPTDLELEEARTMVRRAPRWERRLLKQLYGRDRELWVYATRDSDGDGILDFRVSDYYGRFLEGDTDLDGDGIVNTLDGRPFRVDDSPGISSSLPPHIDWEAQGKPAEMVRIQRELYSKYGVVLVERSESFTPELARAVWDTVTRVYRKVFAQEGSLPTLRTIATEDFSLLDPEDPEGATDFAQVLAATQTLVIYRRGIESAPAIQLGFMAHEIGHNIQFALDYDEKRQQEIIERNYFAATRFHELVEPYGWTTVPLEINPRDEFTLFRPQYLSIQPYEYLYNDEPLDEWEEWLAAIYDEVGEEDYLSDERITELHILGDYSLSGPWEWYSDHVIAYVYLALFDSLASHCSPASLQALEDKFQSEVVAPAWPYFAYENARGDDIQIHLGQVYTMTPEDIAAMAETYLLEQHPGICTE